MKTLSDTPRMTATAYANLPEEERPMDAQDLLVIRACLAALFFFWLTVIFA